MPDWLLALWLCLDALWDAAVIGTLFYLVFWRGHTPWLFLFMFLCTGSTYVYKALRKRFGIPEEVEQ